MKINDNFFKIAEEIQANIESSNFNEFNPIELEESDFDFALELIKKYVSPKTKRYANCLKELEEAKERFIKQETYRGEPYYSFPFKQYHQFVFNSIHAITHRNRDWELSKKLKTEWNLDYWNEFYKYAFPFINFIFSSQCLEKQKERLLEIDLKKVKAFSVKEEK